MGSVRQTNNQLLALMTMGSLHPTQNIICLTRISDLNRPIWIQHDIMSQRSTNCYRMGVKEKENYVLAPINNASILD
jgi:hypothetical protein